MLYQDAITISSFILDDIFKKLTQNNANTLKILIFNTIKRDIALLMPNFLVVAGRNFFLSLQAPSIKKVF